ncbi:MAG: IS4 family transposase [Nanoarchaeota archaeon]|nr:IS4 family transposase [Nanoarchaeota archaeon]
MDYVEDILWIRNQFKGVDLSDKRLVNRLDNIAYHMMAKPNLSIPKQNVEWKDTKAAYRFFDCPKVQFSQLIEPHINQTKKTVKKMSQILAIQDTTFLSYGHHPSVEGLSDIGGEHGSKGMILHTTLAVNPNQSQPAIIGLLDQYLHHRTGKVDKNESYKEKQQRWRESKIWEEASRRISLDKAKTQIIEIMDREADIFDVISNCLTLKHDFVIRAKNDRILDVMDNKKLFDFVRGIKPSGTIQLELRKRPSQIPRIAKLNIAYARVEILGPKNRKDETIECNVVYVSEKNPPRDQEPLEWILLTSIEVNSFKEACQIVEWYKCRWIIEEYHKGIKTGCKIEERQLKTRERLENFLGVANIVAIRILKIRDYARNMPHISAKKVIEPLKVDILLKYRNIKKKDITIQEYYREVAKLGGFLARKSDGEPGWQTLWHGETELTMMTIGAKMALGEKKCG